MAFVCISLPHLFPYLTSRQALPLLSRYLLDASEVQKDTPWFRFPENAFCLSANEARRSRSSRFSSGHGCYVDGDGDPRGLWRSPAAHAAFYGLRSPRLVPRFASVTSRLARSSRQRVVAAGMVGDERRYLRGRSQAGWFVVGVARKNSWCPVGLPGSGGGRCHASPASASRSARSCYPESGIEGLRTPPRSPDSLPEAEGLLPMLRQSMLKRAAWVVRGMA